MSLGSYRRYVRNRRHAGRYVRQRAVEKITGYLFLFLPRLMFWYTVRFIAIALTHLTGLIAAGGSRLLVHRQEKDAAAFNPPVDTMTEQLRADRRRQRDSALEDWDREWATLLPASVREALEIVAVSPEPHEQISPSDEQVSSRQDGELPETRRDMLSRFHAGLLKLQAMQAAQAREHSHPAVQSESERDPIRGTGNDTTVGQTSPLREGRHGASRSGGASRRRPPHHVGMGRTLGREPHSVY